ncbi:MAG: hypothetical protein L0338_29470 [Acidobacteria bacterium]|nr:hypothetical protein [Acidobacteriota bacterium]
MYKLSWLLLVALLQGQTALRNPNEGAVVVLGTHADVICQDSEPGFLVQFTSKTDADYAIIRVFYREKAEGLPEPLLLTHTEVVLPTRGATVMLGPFPTKKADVEKVVVTWVAKTQEEMFTPSQN